MEAAFDGDEFKVVLICGRDAAVAGRLRAKGRKAT